jgi:hypothetical protein
MTHIKKADDSSSTANLAALSGIRVLEQGQLITGPFAKRTRHCSIHLSNP